MNRIGHGKGYYDHFFQRCFEYAKQKERPPPTLGTTLFSTESDGSGCSAENSVDREWENPNDGDRLEDEYDRCRRTSYTERGR